VEGRSTVEDRRLRNSYHRVCYVFVEQAASECHWSWTAMGDDQCPTECDSRLRGTREPVHQASDRGWLRVKAGCVIGTRGLTSGSVAGDGSERSERRTVMKCNLEGVVSRYNGGGPRPDPGWQCVTMLCGQPGVYDPDIILNGRSYSVREGQ